MATPVASTAKTKKSPWPPLLVGVFALLTCIVLTLTQIQTNEANFLHQSVALLRPNWHTLIQPYDYAMGNLDNDMSKAVVWSWVSEIIFLICIIGFEEAHHAISSTWKKLGYVFVFIALFIIGYNIYTDFLYGGSDFWTQTRFALGMSVAVVFFGLIGTTFIEMAIARFK